MYLSNQKNNIIYNIGDCIEFKQFTIYPDVFEYLISNGKIINNNDQELLEVKICSNDQIVWVNPSSIIRHYYNDKISQLTPRIILKEIWKDLIFREIKTVKCKDLYLISSNYINDAGFIRFNHHPIYTLNKTKLDEHYKDYFGFTTHRSIRNNDIHSNQEIFFSKKCYSELNLAGKTITGDFSMRRGFKTVPPVKNQYICGLVEMGERGLFYRKWFVCSKEFLTLWTMVCEPEHHSLKNKTENGYVTKTLDEIMIELNTDMYLSNNNKKFKEYKPYNLENHVLYIPNIYQMIARSLFKPTKNLDNLYLTYEDKFRHDLMWMKNF